MGDEAPRKRSRFDQADPPPSRPSRFDRRSRSPSGPKHDSRRSRSPIRRNSDDREDSSGPSSDAKAAAAAAAARINAEYQSKSNDTGYNSAPGSHSNRSHADPSEHGGKREGVYESEGDFIRDIEINDLRNRYTLTKGSTQKEIKDETGADVTTRGSYYPNKSMATPTNPPLYLHITHTTKEGLEKAIAKIDELMQVELPELADERRFRRPERREPEQRPPRERRPWPEERIPIDLEPIPGFNLRAQVVGHQGTYVKHIQAETRCRVQIKGRGSGFVENSTGQESDEPMFLHVAGPEQEMVDEAKKLCLDLLRSVREQYMTFKERGPRNNYGGGGRGGRDNYGRDRDNRENRDSGGYGQQHQHSQQQQQQDYTAQYAQYYGQQVPQAQDGQDPYAQYGGYDNYVAMYYQWYQQAQQAQQTGAEGAVNPADAAAYAQQQAEYQAAPGAAGAYGTGAPPPPPSNEPPPPPPGVPASNDVPPPPPPPE